MRRWLALCAVAAALAAPGSTAAPGRRSTDGAPAPAGLRPDHSRDQPIQIESATLEVRDKSKIATFSGDVEVVQGDTTIRCSKLIVFYGPEGNSATAKQPPAGATNVIPQNEHDIRKIEARGNVTVVTKDQRASGDVGVYDLKTKTMTLTGNVVVSQGNDIVHGDRVVVNMITGYSRVESSATTPSRVRALILPGNGANGGRSNIMTFGRSGPN